MNTAATSEQQMNDYKERLFEQFGRIGKALSSPRRIELLNLLAQGEQTVEKLAEMTGLSVANTSQHLQVLREACLAETRREGTFIYYRLSGPEVIRLCEAIGQAAENHLAEISQLTHRYVHSRDELEPVGRDELVRRMKSGEVVLIDVRPDGEYASSHIPGALSVPLNELNKRLPKIPKGKEVIAYCRSRYCLMAVEAVNRLGEKGLKARRLDKGFLEWAAADLPVEKKDKSGR